jgi:O-antigen/teichoic acid export membrane protein
LSDNEIRLRYSGFIIFATRILSVATGLLFQLMIARATTTLEYGIWFNINDVSTYFTLLVGVLPFWALRFVARGREGATKTGILANLLMAIIATIIYLLLLPTITSALDIDAEYFHLYMLSALQILEGYSLNALEAGLRAKIPHVIGYGLLIAEGCKVVLGYILIIVFQRPLLGAKLSLITAFALQTFYYLNLLKGDFTHRVNWTYVREWLKGSIVNIYHIVGNQIMAFVFILLFTYGGEGARSNYGAAGQIANVVTYASSLAFALYPKLLANRKPEDIPTSLKTVFMFAIPMTVGVIVLSDSYVIIIKDIYQDAWPILIVLAINAFLGTASNLFSAILFGVEQVDERARISFRRLVKSRLFIVFSLPYLQSAIILPTAFYALTANMQNESVQAAISISLIITFTDLVTCLIRYVITRQMVTFTLPWRNLGKYVFASLVMATVFYLLPHPTRILFTLGMTAIGGIVYFTSLMVIDREARTLVLSIWAELKQKVQITS